MAALAEQLDAIALARLAQVRRGTLRPPTMLTGSACPA